MIGIKYFPENLNIQDKTIILRLDLNVPLKDKKIQDETRIISVLPFLKKLIEKNSKIIIISHLGRPNGIKDKNLSLLPVYKYLKEKIKKLQLEVNKKSELENKFNQDIEELSQETESLAREIDKWQM